MGIEAIRKGLYRITTPFDTTGTVFLYVLKGERVALIDTGGADSPMQIVQPALAEIGMALSDVELVLNTHAHLDHSGGNAEIKRLTRAGIHLHANDLPTAQSLEAEVEAHTAPLRSMDFPPEVVRERGERIRRLAGTPVGTDVILSDGDAIDLGAGVRLTVVHCPGHTPGQVTYVWEAEGIAFTGDAVQGQGSRPGGYPLYFDAPSYRRSLARFQRLDCRVLCLGHAFLGGTLINNSVRLGTEVAAFLRGAADVADTIHQAVLVAVGRLLCAAKREIALAALSELIHDIPQLRQRATGMPLQAGPTFSSHIDAALSRSYPG
jgi:glyoxylase-like metal-dependent hydrolase (beta-lactamase superfamily II)